LILFLPIFLRMDTNNEPPPPKRIKVSRLTEEMKALKPGESAVMDHATARCVMAFHRYNGKEVRQAKRGEGRVAIWIL